MANLKTFSHFPKLPLETRRRIWQHALSVVGDKDHDTKQEYYSDYDDDTDEEEGDRWPSNITPTMTFIGPAPYLVGLFCREARKLMEASYIQFDGLKGGPSASH
jgi:hypothetical protein